MRKRFFGKIIITLSLICLVGFGPHALAEVKEAKKLSGCPYAGKENCQEFKQLKGLSDKEMAQVKSEMDAFHKTAEPVKQNIFEKKMALVSELAKQDTDVDKAKKLQTKIYDLKNQLGQKKVDHLIRVKKISPEAGRFFLKKFFLKNRNQSGCKGSSSCPGKNFKSKNTCPGKEGLEKGKSI